MAEPPEVLAEVRCKVCGRQRGWADASRGANRRIYCDLMCLQDSITTVDNEGRDALIEAIIRYNRDHRTHHELAVAVGMVRQRVTQIVNRRRRDLLHGD